MQTIQLAKAQCQLLSGLLYKEIESLEKKGKFVPLELKATYETILKGC